MPVIGATLGVALAAARVACALDAFEIQVYDQRVNKPGERSAELHANFTAAGRRDPAFAGEIPPDRMARLTLEPAYGLTSWWELGAYLQTAYELAGAHSSVLWDSSVPMHYAGTKLRSKFVLPRLNDDRPFFGVNFEVSYVPTKFEASRWGGELRPIAGWGYGQWLAIVNPILTWSLSGDEKSSTPAFEPAAKLQFDTRKGFGIGAEYYSGLGPIDSMPRSGRQEHVLYAVFDLLNNPTEWNFGVGRGLTPAANDWTIKTIVGRSF